MGAAFELCRRAAPRSPVVPQRAARPPDALPPALRLTLERRFGTSFEDVRVHSDEAAGKAAESLHARAFTQGRDIYFARGQYAPESTGGLALLAHELTHVVQQRQGRFPLSASSRGVARARSRLEDEANRVGASVLSSTSPVEVHEAAPPGLIHRQIDVLGTIADVVSPGTGPIIRVAARRGIEQVVDGIVDHLTDRSDPRLRELAQLRAELRARQGSQDDVWLDPVVVAEMETLYDALLPYVPSWVSMPALSFVGVPTLQAAVLLGIPLIVILLFVLMLILVWWIITNQNPDVRRAREESLGRLIDRIRDALRRQTPERAEPRTEPRAEPREHPKAEPERKPGREPEKLVDPFPIPREDEEDRKRRCRLVRRGVSRGDDPLSDTFCNYVSRGAPSYDIYSPVGRAEIDALRGRTWYECKCGHSSLVHGARAGERWARLRLEGPTGLDEQVLRQSRVAWYCGYSYRLVVASDEVADFFRDRYTGIDVVVVPWEPCE